MAIDKAVDSAALEANLTTIANAIREKAGTSDALAFPAGFAEAIAGIKAGGDIGGRKFGYFTYTSATDMTASFRIPIADTFADGGRSLIFYWTTPHNTAFSADPAKINFGASGVQIIQSNGNPKEGTVNGIVNKYGTLSAAYGSVTVNNGNSIIFDASTSMVVPAGVTVHFVIIDNSNFGG